MHGILGAVIAAGLAATPVTLAPIGGGNAYTLPAQRHVVRVDPGDGAAIWLNAIQQQGGGGRGLVFYRSDDEGQTFSYFAAIQPDTTHRDRADLVVVGHDIALVYSFEDPTFSGSTRHDVYFQWWRYQPDTRGFAPDPAVRVFDSTSSSTGYSRAELAVDSAGGSGSRRSSSSPAARTAQCSRSARTAGGPSSPRPISGRRRTAAAEGCSTSATS